MARYDKVPPGSTFRAPLAAAWPVGTGALGQVGRVTGVSINTSGQVVVGGAVGNLAGVVVVDTAKAVGDIVDVMHLGGEIVECTTTDITGMSAGDEVHIEAATGQLTDTATATSRRIGRVVESGRLVVRIGTVGVAAV